MQTSSSSNSQNSKKPIRRHDIDWLRVILFGLLIPFHVAIGVYWSTYGTEINPNFEEISGEDREEFAENNNDYTAESVTFTSMILHWMHLELHNSRIWVSPDASLFRSTRVNSSC